MKSGGDEFRGRADGGREAFAVFGQGAEVAFHLEFKIFAVQSTCGWADGGVGMKANPEFFSSR